MPGRSFSVFRLTGEYSAAIGGRGASTRVLAEHHPATAWRRGERSECRVGAHRYLARARRAAELFDAIGVHGAAHAAVAEVAAARAERMRPLHADVAGVELHGFAPLHSVPLERFQVELRHDGVAVVRVED